MGYLFRNIALRLCAFVAVMAFCCGLVMIGAWHASETAPAMRISLPSFTVTVKASPDSAHLHAKKADPCPLPANGTLQPDACKPDSPICGRHNGDNCGTVSLFCGCHSHDNGHAGAAVSGAPDILPSTASFRTVSLEPVFHASDAIPRKLLYVRDMERPPAESCTVQA